jgi:hypothetical protein
MHFKAAVSGISRHIDLRKRRSPAVVALDSQATHCFIDKQFALDSGIKCTPAHRLVQLADGSHAQTASECLVHLKLFSADRDDKVYSGTVSCLVIALGEDHNVILGQDWLKKEGAILSFDTDSCRLERKAGLELKPIVNDRAPRRMELPLSAARARALRSSPTMRRTCRASS